MIHYHIANEMNVIKVSLIQIPLMYGSRPMNMKTDTPALLFECLIMEINEVMFILMCALVHVSGILISTHTIKNAMQETCKRCRFHLDSGRDENASLKIPSCQKKNTIDNVFAHKILHIQFSKGSIMVHLFLIEY